jgi:hypothetical protein
MSRGGVWDSNPLSRDYRPGTHAPVATGSLLKGEVRDLNPGAEALPGAESRLPRLSPPLGSPSLSLRPRHTYPKFPWSGPLISLANEPAAIVLE